MKNATKYDPYIAKIHQSVFKNVPGVTRPDPCFMLIHAVAQRGYVQILLPGTTTLRYTPVLVSK